MSESETMPPSQTFKAAMIIVTTVPILVVYPFIQKYFVKGLLIGGVKGQNSFSCPAFLSF